MKRQSRATSTLKSGRRSLIRRRRRSGRSSKRASTRPKPLCRTVSTRASCGRFAPSQTARYPKKQAPKADASFKAEQEKRRRQESLTIRTWEVEYATLLSSFIPTPRGAKRFANIYRLIKAPLSPEDLVAFEGTAANRGEFRAAMLLLAILTGFPQLSARLFRALEDQQTPSITPQQIFADVRKYLPESSLTAQLQDCLTRLGPTDVSLTRQTYLKWIPRVARFSFYTAEVSEATI